MECYNKEMNTQINTTSTKPLNNISFDERIDIYRVKHILTMNNNELLDYYVKYNNENDKEIDKKEMIIELNKARKLCSNYLKLNETIVKKEYKSTSEKRHYLVGDGLQTLPTFIRNYLGHKLYDHDIINSHPSIMLYLSTAKVKNLKNDYLKEYVNNRDKVLVENAIDKHSILKLINTDNPKKQNTHWLNNFVDEVKKIKEVLLSTIPHNYTPNLKKKSNPKSSIFAQILHKWETKVMKIIYSNYPKEVSVPMYDGFLSHSIIPIDDLNKLTEKYGVKWKHKPVESDIIEPETINELSIRDYNFLKSKWEDEISYISSLGSYIINESGIYMNKTNTIDFSANWVCPNEEGKMDKFLPQWLADVNRKCFDSLDFIPYNKDLKEDPTPKNIYNKFIPFKRNKIDGDIEIPDMFNDYLNKGYKDPTKIEYLIKYLSHLIQKPEELPEVIIVLRGLEGAGKDSLIKLISALIGKCYVYSTEDTDPIFGNFNASISGKLIVQLNEMEQKKFIPIQEGLKDFATREYNNINQKYQTERTETNSVRQILVSNHFDPVMPSATDRRYIILCLMDKLVNDKEFWDKFYTWIKNDDEMDKLYTYLLNYDISNWKPKERLITTELRTAQWNNIQPYLKYLYQTLFIEIDKIDKEIYVKCGDGEYRILKKDLSNELEKYYKEVDYKYAKKKVNENINTITGFTKKRCSKNGEFYIINIEQVRETLLNARGLRNFLDFFVVANTPFETPELYSS